MYHGPGLRDRQPSPGEANTSVCLAGQGFLLRAFLWLRCLRIRQVHRRPERHCDGSIVKALWLSESPGHVRLAPLTHHTRQHSLTLSIGSSFTMITGYLCPTDPGDTIMPIPFYPSKMAKAALRLWVIRPSPNSRPCVWTKLDHLVTNRPNHHLLTR
jgi:hypothetical protein